MFSLLCQHIKKAVLINSKQINKQDKLDLLFHI
jgi:hypothetical protein